MVTEVMSTSSVNCSTTFILSAWVQGNILAGLRISWCASPVFATVVVVVAVVVLVARVVVAVAIAVVAVVAEVAVVVVIIVLVVIVVMIVVMVDRLKCCLADSFRV